ncbi:hypothetical protein [Chamaesiphon sp.]|uniref:hypothetical protein n=1 Tax=Chamaesiphon sp. TaxID=2814140 RepID=UPI0035947431
MHHPETETQATENISANPHNISKVIKNTGVAELMYDMAIEETSISQIEANL